MRFLLVLATPKLDAIIAGYRARDTAALRWYDRALTRLNIFGERLDPATQAGQECIPHLGTAQKLFKMIRDTPCILSVASESPGRPGLCATALDTRDPRCPMVIYPAFLAASPDCQAFVIMREYLHVAGVVGDGPAGVGDARPETALKNPSSLAQFAWTLATGSSPICGAI